jgi:hypothetical protein
MDLREAGSEFWRWLELAEDFFQFRDWHYE